MQKHNPADYFTTKTLQDSKLCKGIQCRCYGQRRHKKMNEKISLRTQKDGRKKVMLHLPGKDYKPIRCIGIVERGSLNLYRSGGTHTHRNTGGTVGISYKLLKDYSNHFQKISITYNDKIFFTDRDFLLQHGAFRDYGMNNLERQIFIKLEDLEPERQAELRLKQIKLSKLQQAKKMQTSLF